MKIKLLIVDDEAEICDMLSRHFRYLGYKVETASNGVEALEKLETSDAQIVISDIVMPKMNGVDFLRILHDQHSTVQTIMITGYVTLENAMNCMRYGANTCVFKPLEDLKELQDAVEHAVISLKHWQTKFKMLQLMNPAIAGGSDGRQHEL